MRYVTTGKQMKEIDRYTMEEIGIPSMVLMERAAWAFVEEIRGALKKTDRIWVACGTGNNGADGVAAARMLTLEGFRPVILLAGDAERGTEEFKAQLAIARKLGVPVFETEDFIPGKCEVILDAVFGVGLSRPIEGAYREFMEMLAAQSPRFTAAIDVPSGIHSDSGQVMGIALKADVTVTFGYEKLGCLLYPGRLYCGRLVTADIGFPKSALEQGMAGGEKYAMALDDGDLGEIPRRQRDANKGTYGKLLIVAGSKGMSGAAYMSALAAYRTGAGLCRILTDEENRAILQGQIPEAVLLTYDGARAEADGEAFKEMVAGAVKQATAIVLGPGLGRSEASRLLVETVLEQAFVPVVLDADGLNLVAEHPHFTNYFTENIIVTPHVGEMARLTKKSAEEIKADPVGTARTYADIYGVTCVLKDAATVIAGRDGELYINQSGCPAMAKAGSGDVLSGVIAGLLALGLEDVKAAAMGVCLHGKAGEAAAERTGSHGLLAHETADAVPAVMDAARAAQAEEAAGRGRG